MNLNELEKFEDLRIRTLRRLDQKAIERLFVLDEDALEDWPHGIHCPPKWFCDLALSRPLHVTMVWFRGYGLSPQEAFERAITAAAI